MVEVSAYSFYWCLRGHAQGKADFSFNLSRGWQYWENTADLMDQPDREDFVRAIKSVLLECKPRKLLNRFGITLRRQPCPVLQCNGEVNRSIAIIDRCRTQ